MYRQNAAFLFYCEFYFLLFKAVQKKSEAVFKIGERFFPRNTASDGIGIIASAKAPYRIAQNIGIDILDVILCLCIIDYFFDLARPPAVVALRDGIVIKNMICRNFWNDAYNIHNKVKSVTFDTICAIDCGDDGVSAHEECEIDVRNFLSFGNSTGICHINNAVSRHTDVYIESALGREIYLKGVQENATTNYFKNVYVRSSSAGGVTLGAGAGYIDVENMTIVLADGAKSFDHPGFRGGKSRISRLYIQCKEPEKMAQFKADLLKKFQGEVEKELKMR